MSPSRSIREAIAKFTPVAGQTVMRFLADRGAVASGLTPRDVRNYKYEGHEASSYDVKTSTSTERHIYARESARLTYSIETRPNDPKKKNSLLRVWDVQMP